MGVISKLANFKYESGVNYELGNSLSSNAVSTLFGKGGKRINVLEEYEGFAWKCINIRAETLADQDLYVEKLVGKKWTEDMTHDFNAVLEGGTTDFDQSELLEAHEKSMCLYGESFWYFSKGERYGKPMGVYLLDPSCVTVMVANEQVTGYVYQKDTVHLTLDTDEVLHFFIHDPRVKFRGYGPMQAAGWFVRSARYVNTYVNNFLENNAIPAGVIVAKGTVADDDWKLFKQQWAERYSGIDNAGKTGFVRGSDLEFVKTGLSLGEIDFDKIKSTSRDDIMIMFGISKPMMAIFDDINRASAVTARQLFALTVTSPALRRIKRKLSKKVAVWYGAQYRIGSTNPIPEDEDAALKKNDRLLGRAFTVNEVRAEYGKDPITGGDELDAAVAPSSSGNYSDKAAPPTQSKRLIIRIKSTSPSLSADAKEQFRLDTEELQKDHETKFLKAIEPTLLEQKSRVLNQLKPKKIVDSSFVPADEAQKMTVEVLPILYALAEAQGKLAVKLVEGDDATFKLSSVMETYIHDSVSKALVGFNEDTQAKIATAVAEGLSNGDTIADIAKQIGVIYDEVLGVETPGYRIDRLARTEVIKASNEITEAAYKESGVVIKKEWFANPGACEFCAALNGSIVNLGAPYVPLNGSLEGVDGGTRVNDYEPINHPPQHSNCRCTLIPVIEGTS